MAQAAFADGTILGGAGGYAPGAVTGGAGGTGLYVRYSTDSGSRPSTLYNAGTITGGHGAGGAGGGGVGGIGVDFDGGTLINNGVIAGGMSGDGTPVQAVALVIDYDPVSLAIGQNASFQGAIQLNSTLIFNQALQSSFSADATVSTTIIGGRGISKLGSGVLTLSNGGNTFAGGSTINAGTLDLNAAATITNGVTTAGAAGTGAITFAGASGSLAILALETTAQPASGGTFSNSLNNFDDYDQLDIKGFAFDGRGMQAIPLAMNGNTGTLTIRSGQMSESFTLTGTLARQYYAQSDGNGGTLITDGTVCYASGTRLRTLHGGVETDVAVEDLAVGDLVITSSGEHSPIRWIGSRTLGLSRHPNPAAVMPVRVRAHAFGDNKPARDLVVSPGHSLCVDVLGEVLIPAMALINGSTIIQEDVDSITYWHVELDSHDVILAENMPAESYLEMGNRGFFAENGVVDLDASPEAPVRTHADFCRPFHADGAIVEAVRAQVAARAAKLGWALQDQGLGDLHLIVDDVRLDPQLRGLAARFSVPARAREVWLVSSASVPAAISASSDTRLLGLCLRLLVIDDGFGTPLTIALVSPAFAETLRSRRVAASCNASFATR